LEGGFIHAEDQGPWRRLVLSHRGQESRPEGTAKCFAYAQIYDTKPERRLFELMKSQRLQANQQVTFPSEGADDVRRRCHSYASFRSIDSIDGDLVTFERKEDDCV